MQADESDTLREETSGNRVVARRTPLPVTQLISVCLIQFSEPIAGLCIYPFINQFIRETGITGGDEKKTGYYGGIIESTFFFSEALTVVLWGYAADRFGRRPVFLLAPLGLTISMLSFGLSTNFWSLVIFRCLQGTFNGNIGVSRSIMTESTDSTNRADAFAFNPLVWSVGSTTANLIGGVLSNPAKRWPNGIGRIPLLIRHPYFLPCAVAASLAFTAFIVAFLLLRETLPSIVDKKNQKKDGQLECHPTERTPLVNTSDASVHTLPDGSALATTAPKLRDAFTSRVMIAVGASGFLAFTDMLHSALLPLMWSTSIPVGGLGLDPFHIGVTMASFGAFNAVIQLNLMGPVLRRFGVHRVYRVSIRSFIVCFAMYPLMKFFAQRAGRVDGYVIACMAVQLSCHILINFAYGSAQIIVVESVPRGGPLATANGLGHMLSSVARTVAPTIATSLFSLSLQRNLAGGNFVYYVCIGVTLLGVFGANTFNTASHTNPPSS